MQIQPCSVEHLEPWAQLRAALWPDRSAEAHRSDLARSLQTRDGSAAAFIARAGSGEIIGFAEATLRRDYVNGCATSPVLFLEGLYVRPTDRRKGAARALCKAVEAWGRAAGCTEFGSDALLENSVSYALHAALGFAETERVVFFRKLL